MINEDLKKVLSIVSEAQEKIFLAQSYYDKRKKEKAIRDAKLMLRIWYCHIVLC